MYTSWKTSQLFSVDKMKGYRDSITGNHSGFDEQTSNYSGAGVGENIGANIPLGFKDKPYDNYDYYLKTLIGSQDRGVLYQWQNSPVHNALLLVDSRDGVKITKACVASRLENYGILVVLLVGDR